MPVPPAGALPVLFSVADTLVAYTIPVRGVLGWATDVLVVLLLGAGVVLVGTLGWLAIRLARVLDRLAGAADALGARLVPVLDAAAGVVSDTRDTLGVVRHDVEALSAAAAAVGSDVRDASAAVGARLRRLVDGLETLQEEFEHTVRVTARALRMVRRGAVLMGRLLGARRPRRTGRPARRNRDAADG